jgi:hypothetical protein
MKDRRRRGRSWFAADGSRHETTQAHGGLTSVGLALHLGWTSVPTGHAAAVCLGLAAGVAVRWISSYQSCRSDEFEVTQVLGSLSNSLVFQNR